MKLIRPIVLTILLTMLFPILSVPALAAETKIRFTVDAGGMARRNTPLAATLPAGTELQTPGWYDLVPERDGAAIITQVHRIGDEGPVVRWIEPHLAANSHKTYELRPHQGLPDMFFYETDADTRTLRFGNGSGASAGAGRTSQPVLRDMFKYDPADRENTFKPYMHVFDFHDPDVFITKGPGGKYTHHRGIFFGFKAFDGDTLLGDFWHCNNGATQRHTQCDHAAEFLGPVAAREIEATNWVDKDGKAVVRDTRQITTWRVSPTHYVLDCDVTVESLTKKPIKLGGDAHHAGWHFRAAQEVAEVKDDKGKEVGTKYLRPPTAKLTKDDIYADCAWVHASFDVHGHHYQLTHMDWPQNPRPTTYSTRPYGRVGAFFTTEVPADKPLHLRYRLDLFEGETPSAEEVAAAYQAFVMPVKVTP